MVDEKPNYRLSGSPAVHRFPDCVGRLRFQPYQKVDDDVTCVRCNARIKGYLRKALQDWKDPARERETTWRRLNEWETT